MACLVPTYHSFFLLQDKYEMRTSKARTGGGSVVRQFSLIIKDIREEDYGEIILSLPRTTFSLLSSGNYTCQATNSLGRDSQQIEVSGKPLPPRIIAGTPSMLRTEYTLRWRVHSAFPVKEHNIFIETILDGQFISEASYRCQGERDCSDCRILDSCKMITR